MEHRTSIKQATHIAKKKNLSESDSENEITEFSRFIVIELLEETPLAKLSPFFIKRVISREVNPQTLKKMKSVNLLIKVVNKKFN